MARRADAERGDREPSEPVRPAGREPNGADRMARGYARSRARDDAVRATLRPLAPGERPRAIAIAAAAAALIGLANVILAATGWDIDGGRVGGTGSGLAFAAFMLLLAAGMWRLAYLAVLAFQALLGVSVIYAFLALLLASNVVGALLAGAVIAGGGTLFWFLVRPMARLQLTRRMRGTPDARVG